MYENDPYMDQIDEIKADPSKATFIRGVEALGEKIRLERRKRKLTQAELAARSGVSRRFLYQLENGSRDSFPLGKVLQVIHRLNLAIQIVPRVVE